MLVLEGVVPLVGRQEVFQPLSLPAVRLFGVPGRWRKTEQPERLPAEAAAGGGVAEHLHWPQVAHGHAVDLAAAYVHMRPRKTDGLFFHRYENPSPVSLVRR